MPTLRADTLERVARDILGAAGALPDIAGSVAQHLVDSDLCGVPSHGMARVPRYVDQIRERVIDPRARATVEDRGACQALVNGNGGFGILALDRALEVATTKSAETGIAAAAIVNCGHTGRIGHYVERAAARGCLGIVFGGGGHKDWSTVVPYGGRKPVFSTNPYAFAVPGGAHGPVVADFATSASATGRLAIASARKELVPDGWILDSAGRPSRDPEDFYNGGMQLPAAGAKGYAMALVAELIGYALLGEPVEFNWLFIALDLGTFRSPEAYSDDAEQYLATVRACPPADGFAAVQIPGEMESREREQRLREGVSVPEEIWQQIRAAARDVGASLPEGPDT